METRLPPETPPEEPAQPGLNQSILMAVVVAFLFFLGLLITEIFGEIPVDIDFKPYFIPLFFAVLLPKGATSWWIALGAASGEFAGDLIEGIEWTDDPIGFVSYILAFAAAAFIAGERERQPLRLLYASLAAAAINAVIEGAAFYAIESVGLPVTLRSITGNIITHGLIMGWIPLWLLVSLWGEEVKQALNR